MNTPPSEEIIKKIKNDALASFAEKRTTAKMLEINKIIARLETMIGYSLDEKDYKISVDCIIWGNYKFYLYSGINLPYVNYGATTIPLILPTPLDLQEKGLVVNHTDMNIGHCYTLAYDKDSLGLAFITLDENLKHYKTRAEESKKRYATLIEEHRKWENIPPIIRWFFPEPAVQQFNNY